MIVTSFSASGYEEYGKRFLESYVKHCNIPLTIFTEEPISGLTTKSLWDIQGCQQFVELVSHETTKPIRNGYRFNTNKFCRKVFALHQVATSYQGNIAWLDADTVLHRDIPDDFLETLLEDVYVAYLGRENYHSETGFVALDTTHKVNQLFQFLYLREYTSGAYHDLHYWCDSDIFDHVRTLISPPERNLNVCGSSNNPFGKSILGKYMKHYKGVNKC